MFDNRAPRSFTIGEIEIGMAASRAKEITERDILLFAEVSTDRNPVHLDEDYARETVFEGRIAHGMLTAALVSAVIGEQLPGHGSIYMGQNMTFLAPVRLGDVLEARVTVTGIEHDKRRVTLETQCFVGNRVVLKGEALVKVPSRKFD